MSFFGKTGKQQKDRPPLTDILLGVAMLSVLPLVFVAPGLIRIADLFGNEWRVPQKRAREALRRLEKRGQITIKPSKKNSWNFELTKLGKEVLKRKQVETLKLHRPKQWDGLWRLVIFDIPESNRSARENLRWKLQDLGFQYLNLSVWACPHPCKDEVNAVAEYYGVGKYVRFIEATHVDGLPNPLSRLLL